MKVGFSDLELKVLLESPIYVSVYSVKDLNSLLVSNRLASMCIEITKATSNAMVTNSCYRAGKLLVHNNAHFLNRRTWIVNRDLIIEMERC